MLKEIDPFTEQPRLSGARASGTILNLVPPARERWAWLVPRYTSSRGAPTSIGGSDIRPDASVEPPSSSGRSRAMADLTEAMIQLIEVMRRRALSEKS